MRRFDPVRFSSVLAGAAVGGLVLAACGNGGGGDAAPSSTADGPSPAASKALVQADLPEGFTVTTVPADTALMSSLQAVQQMKDVEITPAGCKDKNVAAQQEVADTVKFGTQQNVARAQQVAYGVNFLPAEAKLSVFEAAGTGECAAVRLGAVEQTTTRKDLPTGTGAQGFVLEFARSVGDQKAESANAYFSKGGVTAMVFANPGADGTLDRTGFEDMVKRVAAKL
ncbi:hypothetical protein TPAU25S_02346 [Tsukamurella paurometabola]|uniref:DUF5642 domain-containing protein n=1 Tax=Tsukamurella paurometabola (strain ATCC 8368 / DSM 20162 / CCUG 35730 / CIP 100753 / JCM 10117 / KCTC 9821 / NBRC 16120 / NCIMB 702349 / NCTC 13040) TaxID=521096 RepID=D5USC4_TSUPD|nr:hypothetical protein [Tsukamurella paurometabola]ADG77191.1 hypothetical protein Tpau_0551 [Tsukamurella paurometabola DSM 20162]SUP43107.1 Uncharacterised protein [Tsukamurella paurometabola]